MEQNNLYYDMNENPNIFPPSKSYIPQTQIRQRPGVINKNFQKIAFQQQEDANNKFFASGNQNLSVATKTPFANANMGSRESRQSSSTGNNTGYANMPSTNNNSSGLGVVPHNVYDNEDADENVRHQEHQLQLDAQRQNYGIPYNSQGDVILQSNDINNQLTDHMAYPHVFTPQPFLQLPQNNLINDPDPYYLSIDSHDRDRTKYPNPNNYTIHLVSSDTTVGGCNVPGIRYKNITEIELVGAVIPNKPGVLDEIYLILQIEEIDNPVFHSTNPNLSKGFAKLFFVPPADPMTTKWLYLDLENTKPLIKKFYPKPKSSLDRISIKLLKRDGTPFSFGTDMTLPSDVNPLCQNSFTFKITQKITDIDVIGQRNI
jgi:hypothetical protein